MLRTLPVVAVVLSACSTEGPVTPTPESLDPNGVYPVALVGDCTFGPSDCNPVESLSSVEVIAPDAGDWSIVLSNGTDSVAMTIAESDAYLFLDRSSGSTDVSVVFLEVKWYPADYYWLIESVEFGVQRTDSGDVCFGMHLEYERRNDMVTPIFYDADFLSPGCSELDWP